MLRKTLISLSLSVMLAVTMIPQAVFATAETTEGASVTLETGENETTATEAGDDTVTTETEGNTEQDVTTQGDTTEDATTQNYTTDMTPEEIVANMTLEQKIGQMIMPAFRKWSDGQSGSSTSSVTAMNDDIADAVSSLGLGGVILFAENIEATEQTVRLVNDFQTAATKDTSLSKIPMLISTDQEGGSVCRVKCGTCLCGNMALAAGGSLDDTAASAEIIRSELQALGINVDFSPVMDINNNPNNPIIGVRSFSDDPDTVSKYGTAFIKALQSNSTASGTSSAGVACALKHFPGHGDTETDSHTGLPSVDKKYSDLKDFELATFQSGIDAGADIIMTAHIQFPNIEKETYTSIKDGSEITLPATLSDNIITGILRTTMDYDGVVSTDALDMDAIAKHFDPQDSARLAINAGVDVLLMPVTIENSSDITELEAYIDGIAQQVRAGKIKESRITESALRILKLKEKRGILGTTTDDVEQKITTAKSIVGCQAHHDKEMEITLRTITLLKNENQTLPFKGTSGTTTAVFCPYNNEVEPFRDGAKRLAKAGKLAHADQVEVYSYNEYNNKELYDDEGNFAYAGALAKADQIAVSVESGSTASLTGWQSKFTDALIKEAHKAGKKVLFISTQLPYDAARYQAADSIILSYNPKGAWDLTSGPSFAAALMIAYGYQKPSGKLPVTIPTLNSDYTYSDTVLYKKWSGMTDFEVAKPIVKPVPTIKVKVCGKCIKKGKTVKIKKRRTRKIKAYGMIAGDKVKSWKSSKKRVVKVTSKGYLKTRRRGTATITIRTKLGASFKFKVRVR